MEDDSRLSTTLPGTWELVSGETVTASGRVASRSGAVPVALVMYDRGGNFSAQFMRRDRDADADADAGGGHAARNNTRTIAGYDAYFGRYVVDDAAGIVTQTLVGSLAAENVGQVVARRMLVDGDELTIRVDTETPDGEAATMTLRWRRLSE